MAFLYVLHNKRWLMVDAQFAAAPAVYLPATEVTAKREDPTKAVVYWSADRRALRLRTNSVDAPVAEWRTVGEEFQLNGTELISAASIHGRAPTTLLDVLFTPDGAHIALVDPKDIRLKWFALRKRAEHWDPMLWGRDMVAQPTPAAAAATASATKQEMRKTEIGASAEPPKQTEKTMTEKAEDKTTEAAKEQPKKGALERVKDTVVSDTTSAAWRVAAIQATRTSRDLLLTGMRKSGAKNKAQAAQLDKVLQTPLGEAALSYLLGLALEVRAGEDSRRARLAQELRVNGEAAAMNVLADPLREFLTTGLDMMLDKVLPATEAVRVRIESDRAQPTQESEPTHAETDSGTDRKAEARATN